MVQSVAASVGSAAGHAAWETGKFTVTNPVARKVAMVALSYFVGPCALVATCGYLTMNALGNPNVLGWFGVKDPKAVLLAKVAVTVLFGAAFLEVVSASATVAKVAALCGFVFYAAPEIAEIVAGEKKEETAEPKTI